MAQIINRGKKKYLVRVFLGRKPGQARYLDKMIHGDKKAAQQYADATETKRDLGLLDQPEPKPEPEPYDPLLKDYLDGWYKDFKRPNIRESTAYSYEDVIRCYLKPYLGDLHVSALTDLAIQNAYNRLSKDGYSPRTIKFAHGLLREALDRAVKDKLIPANPSLSTSRPKRKKPIVEPFTPEEAQALIKASQEDPQGIVFIFALGTGARPEEYRALRWEDVDLGRCLITIRRTLFDVKGGGWRFEDVKTDSSRRTIEFDVKLRDALQMHKRKQAARRLKAGSKYHNHDLVFATPKGMPLQDRNLASRHMKPILKRAKIGGATNLYRMRHTFATLSLFAGVDAKTVSEALGHASVAFTLDTYAHVLPKMRKDAAERLGAILFK